MDKINHVDALALASSAISLENEVRAAQTQVPHSNDDHRPPSAPESEAANDHVDGDVQTVQTGMEEPRPTPSLPDIPGEVLRTVMLQRVSSEFIGPRNCVPMAFINESPPAQGRKSSRSVVCLLEQKDMIILSEACRALRQLQRAFASGQQAFPLSPTVDERYGNVDDAVEVCTKTGVLRKAVRPGMGTIIARERVDKMTCYWEFQIEAFTGVRLEIGVATRRSVRKGGLDKVEVWVFDCYGRACHGTRVRGYGCKVKAGDTIGVLLNTDDSSLSFFLQGKNMGTAFRNVRAPSGQGLYPLVVMPSVAHETVRLMRCPFAAGATFPAPVGALLARRYEPRRHPHDWSIIVQSYDAQAVYRLNGLDPTRTTVGGLKEALIRCGNMEPFSPGQLALRTKGTLLTDDSTLLSNAGVSFGSQGAQLTDILVYLPHLIS